MVAALSAGCAQQPEGLERVSLNGFDPGDNAADWNDCPWSMTYFIPDGKQEGRLYAGTANVKTGFEVWKFEGPGGQGPVRVIANGATGQKNMAVSSLCAFRDALYLGAMIVGGARFRGALDILFGKRLFGPLAALFDMGGDLYRSTDGKRWAPVFTNGMGDPYNFGVRNMVSLDGWLYLGLVNDFDGLEIWRGEKAAQ